MGMGGPARSAPTSPEIEQYIFPFQLFQRNVFTIHILLHKIRCYCARTIRAAGIQFPFEYFPISCTLQFLRKLIIYPFGLVFVKPIIMFQQIHQGDITSGICPYKRHYGLFVGLHISVKLLFIIADISSFKHICHCQLSVSRFSRINLLVIKTPVIVRHSTSSNPVNFRYFPFFSSDFHNSIFTRDHHQTDIRIIGTQAGCRTSQFFTQKLQRQPGSIPGSHIQPDPVISKIESIL